MSDDVLELLRDYQGRSDAFGPRMSFDEFRLEKARGNNLAHISPGLGMMGHLNTNSRAPTGPPDRRSGNQMTGLKGEPWFGRTQQQFGVPSGVTYNQGESQYHADPRMSPAPWIDDVDMENIWYSPFQPVWPFGPPYYTRPREWNFPVGYNLNYVPTRLELVSTLRGMRQNWGLLSTVIETRKDQLLRLPWAIQRKDKPKATSKTVDELRRFFKRPDGKLTFGQWARKVMDDLFVPDCASIFIERNANGRPRACEVLDGGTIFPLIDDIGRRPDTDYVIDQGGSVQYSRRQPAFQQIIYGLPMINISEDELIYAMMRPRPELPVFGYSPVEQILVEATEGIRKTFYQLEFWRSGSMPELVITVPDNWNPRQIATFQAHFDALLSGNLQLKSKVRFLPGGSKPFDIKNASGESLWSQRDELLARLVCFAFSIPPTPFVRMMNRGTAQNAAQTAQEEGLYPLMSWWKDDVLDRIIQDVFGYDDIEAVFLPRPEVDLLKQAQIHEIKLKMGEITIDEARDESGLEPMDKGMGAVPLIYTGAGAMPLEQAIKGEILMPGSGFKPGGTDGKPTPPKPAQSRPVQGPAAPASTGASKGARYDAITAEANRADTNPTHAQHASGNYRKGHINLHGLQISIENPKGSTRRGHEPDGTKWKSKMGGHYGYIRGTMGADGDPVDVCIGPHPKSNAAFVLDQVNAETGQFDESKVFLGFRSGKAALKAYLKSNGDGLGALRCSAMVEMSIDDLKRWLSAGNTRIPVSSQNVGERLFKSDTISSSTGLSWYDQGPKVSEGKLPKKRRRKLPKGPKWLELAA